MAMSKEFKEALDKFMEGAQAKVSANMAQYPNLSVPELTATKGRRYIRVVKESSVYCFVDKTNGDVLKAAGWKAPAKHARGNIFNEDNGVDAVGPYGANYL